MNTNERKPLLSDFYERMIDEGKLRVVEEVMVSKDESGWQAVYACAYCGAEFMWADWIIPNKPEPNYCPGCGNKIKR